MRLLQSKLLQPYPKLVHAFTDKSCGNLAFHVNDDLKNVITNHRKLAEVLTYDLDTLVHMKQIHSDIVHIVYSQDKFNNPPTCDALITDKLNTPLMVMVADCSPILFFDPIKRVVAVAHAGREGTFTNIVQNVINIFSNNYRSNTKDIIVSIGPSILECCYEVGDEIYEIAKKLNYSYAMQQKNNKYHLNISTILLNQLLDAGIKRENIEISKECTKCLNHKYYSYRADRNCGRFAGIIYLQS